jgi:hypothetical protein
MQVSHMGANKITMSTTGTARMKGPIAESGGRELMTAPSTSVR